jgi:hypothetical protein
MECSVDNPSQMHKISTKGKTPEQAFPEIPVRAYGTPAAASLFATWHGCYLPGTEYVLVLNVCVCTSQTRYGCVGCSG